MIASEIVRDIDAIDWSDLGKAEQHGREILRQVSAPECITSSLAAIDEQPFFEASERKSFQDTYVMHRNTTGATLRLHHFRPGHEDRSEFAHNHRWPFVALIVKGGYRHEVFVPVNTDKADKPKLVRALVRDEGPGTAYVFGTHLFHMIKAKPDTVSLILRGPAELAAAQFLSVDGKGEDFSRVSRDVETVRGVQKSGLNAADLDNLRDQLSRWGLASPAAA
jgi:hypothetical protein